MGFISIFILPYYNYYDYPEGTAPFHKVYATAKYGFAAGLIMSTVDTTLFIQPKTWTAVFNNVGYYTVPLTAMGAAFASTTYIATTMRKKDDKLNYAFGALASTAVFNLWTRNTAKTGFFGGIMMLAAMMQKDAAQSGYKLFPSQLERRERAVFKGFTWTKDPREIKGWNPNTKPNLLY